MNFYATRLEVILVAIILIAAMSWMGNDQLNDQIKTAEVVDSITTTPQIDPQAEHRRQLAEIDNQGRYMTSYDQVARK